MSPMNPSLPPFNSDGCLHVIAETPKGARNKYSFDFDLGIFRLKKVLPAGAVFPFDFGFIPGTLGEDGDPLDVLLLLEEPALPGCLIEARLLGVMVVSQTRRHRKLRNDRFIAVPHQGGAVCQPKTIKGLGPELLDQLKHFFVSYNAYEGQELKLLKIAGPGEARRLIETAAGNFKRAARPGSR
jgi:inorganic pyrophosphatase